MLRHVEMRERACPCVIPDDSDVAVGGSAVQVAGGLVVAHAGWQFLHKEPHSDTMPGTSIDAALGSAFYPLTLPLTVGPGCISIAITIGAHLSGEHTFEMHSAAILGMLALCGLVRAVYANAYQLAKMLGPTGTNILVRLSAFVLFALGLQIVWNGISAVLHLR